MKANATISKATGFTLIELMVVVAIIAILAAITLPAYQAYRVRSAESACLAEAKNYATHALSVLYSEMTPPSPSEGACASIDAATAMTTPINATPRSPGTKKAVCNMQSATCALN